MSRVSLGLAKLALRLHVGERAHVVQSVRELDDHHTNVPRHRQKHLAEVFGLCVLQIQEVELGKLGDAVHKPRHVITEFRPYVVEGYIGVFYAVVKQTGANGAGIHANFGQQQRGAERVLRKGFTRLAHLSLVGPLGKGMGLPNAAEVLLAG